MTGWLRDPVTRDELPAGRWGAVTDWTEFDAVNILALPLHRYVARGAYRVEGGWSGELRRVVYANGTEQGFATERAETVMELGPMLTRVLLEGVRALEKDPQFEDYIGALAAGDHDRIIAIERALEGEPELATTPVSDDTEGAG